MVTDHRRRHPEMKPGDRVGKLTLVERVNVGGRARWVCRCDCGKETRPIESNLQKAVGSCGCLRKRTQLRSVPPFVLGERFGNLTVLGGDFIRNKREQRLGRWLCRCDCGEERFFLISNVRAGYSKSCGCIGAAKLSELMRTHGGSETAAYRRWQSMIGRCTNTNFDGYDDYGGRGIDVCHGWLESFESYRTDTEPQPPDKTSIDRVNNNLGYHCGHCLECQCYGQEKNWRWATQTEQARNTRRNQWITVGDETMLAVDWARGSGLSRQLISLRIKNGWPPDRAVTKPLDKKASRHAKRIGLGRYKRAA